MATSVSAAISNNITVQHTKTLALVPYGGTLVNTFSQNYTSTDVDSIFSDVRTLSGSESLNLLGSLVDAFGNVLNFTTVKYVNVTNNASNSVTLAVGGGAAPILANSVTLASGGNFVISNNAHVVSGASQYLNVTSSGTTTYNVIILGKS